ncbi:MAG: hypothetical protein JJU45_06375, partial [Acidimicrobiia bacterium]|nr:hypothetical protein [Acidimicrobiia bacterium]
MAGSSPTAASLDAALDPAALLDSPPLTNLVGSGSSESTAAAGPAPSDLVGLTTNGVILADPAGTVADRLDDRQQAADDLARAKADYLRDLERMEAAAGHYADAARNNDPIALHQARVELQGLQHGLQFGRSRVEAAESQLQQADQAIADLAEAYPAAMEEVTGHTPAEWALLEEYHALQGAVAQASAEAEALGDWRIGVELQAEQQQWVIEKAVAQAEVQSAQLDVQVAHAHYHGAMLTAATEASVAMMNPLNYLDPDVRDQALTLLANPFDDPAALFELLTTVEILPFDHPSLVTLKELQTSRQEATEALDDAVAHLEFTVNASVQVDVAIAQLGAERQWHQLELNSLEQQLAAFESDHPGIAELAATSDLAAAQAQVAEAERALDALTDARIAHLERLSERVAEVGGSISWADLGPTEMAALVGPLAVADAMWAGTEAFDHLETMLQLELHAAESALQQLMEDAESSADEGGPTFVLGDADAFAAPEGLVLATEPTTDLAAADEATAAGAPADSGRRPVEDEPAGAFSKGATQEPAGAFTKATSADATGSGGDRDLFGQGEVAAGRPSVADSPSDPIGDPTPIDGAAGYQPGAGPPPGAVTAPEPPMSSTFDPAAWSWVDDVDLWFDGSSGTFHSAPGAPPVPADEAPTVVRAGTDLLADGAALGPSSGTQFAGHLPLGAGMPAPGLLEGDDLWFDARTGAFHQGAPDGPVVGFHQSALEGAVHIPNRGSWYEAARQEHVDHLLDLGAELQALTAQAAALEASLTTASQQGSAELALLGRDPKDTPQATDAKVAAERGRVDQTVAELEQQLAAIEARTEALQAERWLLEDTLGFANPASPYASMHEAELRYLLGDEVVDRYDGLDLSYEAPSYAFLGGGDVINVGGTWFELDESGAWAARDWPTVLPLPGGDLQNPPPEFLLWELTAGTDLDHAFAGEFGLHFDGSTGAVLAYDPGAWTWVDAPDGVGGWWEDTTGQPHDHPGGPALADGMLSETGWVPPEVSLTEVLAVQQVGGWTYLVDLSSGVWLGPGHGILAPSAIPPGPFTAVGVDVPVGETWYVNPTTGTYHSDGGSGMPPVVGPDGAPGFPLTDVSAAALAGSVSHHNTGLAFEAQFADAVAEAQYLDWAISQATAEGDAERVAALEADRAAVDQWMETWYDDPAMAYVHFGGVEVTFVGDQWLARNPDGTPPWQVLSDGSPYLNLAEQDYQLAGFLGRELAVGTAINELGSGSLQDLGLVVDGATGEFHTFDPTRWQWVDDPDSDGGWWSDADGKRFDVPNGRELAADEISSVGDYDSRLALDNMVYVQDSTNGGFLYDPTTGSFHGFVAGTLQPREPEPPLVLTAPGPHGPPLVLDRPENTLLHVDVEHGVLRDGPDGPVVGGLPAVALQRWEVVDPTTGDVAVWYTSSTHAHGPAGELVPIDPYVQIADLPG